jgi:FixJ family two-component response regulator
MEQPESYPSSPSSSLAPARVSVCVVDSDAEVCNALRLLLSGLNAEVLSFNSAEKFLEAMIDKSRIGCLLVEVNLPGMTGIELLERLHKTGYSIPSIVLATFSDVPTAVRAMQARAIDFIEKPFVPSLLFRRIKQILQSKAGAQT